MIEGKRRIGVRGQVLREEEDGHWTLNTSTRSSSSVIEERSGDAQPRLYPSLYE